MMRIYRPPLAYDVGASCPLSRLVVLNGTVSIIYVHVDDSGSRWNVAIEFEQVIAYKYTQHGFFPVERLATAQVKLPEKQAGQILVEFEESPWLQEMADTWRQGYGRSRGTESKTFPSYKLYQLCIWDEGCHEVVALSFKIVKTEVVGK